MPTIRIRIGASVEADFGALIYRPLVEQAKAARAAVRKELEGIGADIGRIGATGGRRRSSGAGAGAGASAGAGSSGGGPYRSNAVEAEVQVVRQRNRRIETEEERHQRVLERQRREADRKTKSDQDALERDLERSRQRHMKQWGNAMGGAAMGTLRNAGGMARGAVGVASDLAAGAGVQFSLGGALRSRFDLEKRSIDLSNASFMPGAAGAAGQRQDPRQLMAEAQAAAGAAALDVGQVMEGLQAFVGKTGDLATGRAVLKDIAVLARATGADMQDIVSAAGDVSANLGEVGDKFKTPEAKAKAVASVMGAMAAQGKVGAVEMKDLATQMAKLAASAPQFAGPVEQSMAAMGALAQMARAKGGAASATQATTSVQAFVSTFGKAARRKELKAAGVQIEDAQGMLLDPEEIIVNALKKTGGSKAKMNKLFMDAGAQRVTNGFRNVFTQAEAQQKGSGEAAVRAEFAKLKGASMSASEKSGSFEASMKSGEAKAQLLKNQIEQQLGDAVERVAPKLLDLAPRVGQATEAFGGLVGWIASNPMKAAFAGIGLSAAKAIGEQVIRVGAERATEAVAKGGMGALGGAGAVGALVLTAATVTLFARELKKEDEAKKLTAQESTVELLSNASKVRDQMGLQRAKIQSAQMVIDEEMAKPEAKRDAKRLEEAAKQKGEATLRQDELAQQAADLQKQLQGDLDNAADIDQKRAEGGAFFGAKTMLKTAGFEVDAPGRRDVASAEATAAKLDEVRAANEALKSLIAGGIKVEVTNLPGPGAPTVNPLGRTP